MLTAIKNVDIKNSDQILSPHSVLRIELEGEAQGYRTIIARYVPMYGKYRVEAVVASTAKTFRMGEKTLSELVGLLNSLRIEPCSEVVEWLQRR